MERLTRPHPNRASHDCRATAHRCGSQPARPSDGIILRPMQHAATPRPGDALVPHAASSVSSRRELQEVHMRRMHPQHRPLLALIACAATFFLSAATSAQPAFIAFDSGPVRPIALVAGRKSDLRGEHPGQPARDLRRRERQPRPRRLRARGHGARGRGGAQRRRSLGGEPPLGQRLDRRPHSHAGPRVAHPDRGRRAARHRLRRLDRRSRVHHHRPSRAAARARIALGRARRRRPAVHHRGHRTRRRLGLRCNGPGQQCGRHARGDPDVLRRHPARPRHQPRRQHRLCRGVHVGQPDHRGGRDGGQRRTSPGPTTTATEPRPPTSAPS